MKTPIDYLSERFNCVGMWFAKKTTKAPEVAVTASDSTAHLVVKNELRKTVLKTFSSVFDKYSASPNYKITYVAYLNFPAVVSQTAGLRDGYPANDVDYFYKSADNVGGSELSTMNYYLNAALGSPGLIRKFVTTEMAFPDKYFGNELTGNSYFAWNFGDVINWGGDKFSYGICVKEKSVATVTSGTTTIACLTTNPSGGGGNTVELVRTLANNASGTGNSKVGFRIKSMVAINGSNDFTIFDTDDISTAGQLPVATDTNSVKCDMRAWLSRKSAMTQINNKRMSKVNRSWPDATYSKWSHYAITVTPDRITMYKNGAPFWQWLWSSGAKPFTGTNSFFEAGTYTSMASIGARLTQESEVGATQFSNLDYSMFHITNDELTNKDVSDLSDVFLRSSDLSFGVARANLKRTHGSAAVTAAETTFLNSVFNEVPSPNFRTMGAFKTVGDSSASFAEQTPAWQLTPIARLQSSDYGQLIKNLWQHFSGVVYPGYAVSIDVQKVFIDDMYIASGQVDSAEHILFDSSTSGFGPKVAGSTNNQGAVISMIRRGPSTTKTGRENTVELIVRWYTDNGKERYLANPTVETWAPFAGILVKIDPDNQVGLRQFVGGVVTVSFGRNSSNSNLTHVRVNGTVKYRHTVQTNLDNRGIALEYAVSPGFLEVAGTNATDEDATENGTCVPLGGTNDYGTAVGAVGQFGYMAFYGRYLTEAESFIVYKIMKAGRGLRLCYVSHRLPRAIHNFFSRKVK